MEQEVLHADIARGGLHDEIQVDALTRRRVHVEEGFSGGGCDCDTQEETSAPV